MCAPRIPSRCAAGGTRHPNIWCFRLVWGRLCTRGPFAGTAPLSCAKPANRSGGEPAGAEKTRVTGQGFSPHLLHTPSRQRTEATRDDLIPSHLLAHSSCSAASRVQMALAIGGSPATQSIGLASRRSEGRYSVGMHGLAFRGQLRQADTEEFFFCWHLAS